MGAYLYQWEGDDTTGSLNPNRIAEGVDCCAGRRHRLTLAVCAELRE